MDMNDVSVGVSKSGFDTIKDNIHLKLVTEAEKKLNDTGDLETALKNAWSGEDCEKFITNFKTTISEVCDALKNYDKQISDKLDAIYGDWETFQKNNVA